MTILAFAYIIITLKCLNIFSNFKYTLAKFCFGIAAHKSTYLNSENKNLNFMKY